MGPERLPAASATWPCHCLRYRRSSDLRPGGFQNHYIISPPIIKSVSVGLTVGLSRKCHVIRSLQFTPHAQLEITTSFQPRRCNSIMACWFALACPHFTAAFRVRERGLSGSLVGTAYSMAGFPVESFLTTDVVEGPAFERGVFLGASLACKSLSGGFLEQLMISWDLVAPEQHLHFSSLFHLSQIRASKGK